MSISGEVPRRLGWRPAPSSPVRRKMGARNLGGEPPRIPLRMGHETFEPHQLDQHKEIKSRDPTIREKFDTCRYADHKERVIALLGQVVAVSVPTVRIVGEIERGAR